MANVMTTKVAELESDSAILMGDGSGQISNYTMSVRVKGDLRRDLKEARVHFPTDLVSVALKAVFAQHLDHAVNNNPNVGLAGSFNVTNVSLPDPARFLNSSGEEMTVDAFFDSLSRPAYGPGARFGVQQSGDDALNLIQREYHLTLIYDRDAYSDLDVIVNEKERYGDSPVREALFDQFVSELQEAWEHAPQVQLYSFTVTAISYPEMVAHRLKEVVIPKPIDHEKLRGAFTNLDALAQQLRDLGVQGDLNGLRSQLERIEEKAPGFKQGVDPVRHIGSPDFR